MSGCLARIALERLCIRRYADLVLWDPAETRQIRGAELESGAGFSIYEGLEITGWPQTTIRRGAVVYEEGRITAQPGTDQLLRRGPLRPL